MDRRGRDTLPAAAVGSTSTYGATFATRNTSSRGGWGSPRRPPGAENPAPPAPPDTAPPPGGEAPQAAPSAFSPNGATPGPSVAVTQYDPRTGQYFGPDGQTYRQTNLATSAAPKTWQGLMAK